MVRRSGCAGQSSLTTSRALPTNCRNSSILRIPSSSRCATSSSCTSSDNPPSAASIINRSSVWSLMTHLLAQFLHRVVQPRSHRPHRNLQHGRDLLVGQIIRQSQLQRLAHFLRQRRNRQPHIGESRINLCHPRLHSLGPLPPPLHPSKSRNSQQP